MREEEEVREAKRRKISDISEDISFPIHFLRNLYNAGHEVVWKKKFEEADLLDVISNQLIGFHPFFKKNLRDELIMYQKDNVEMLKSSPFLVGFSWKGREKKNDKMKCVQHIEKLERKERLYDAFDVDCVSRMMKTRIRIYFPDYSSETMLGKKVYNPEECLYEIAIVMDYSKYPAYTYCTFPVVSENGRKNPYEMMDVGSATHLVCRERKK